MKQGRVFPLRLLLVGSIALTASLFTLSLVFFSTNRASATSLGATPGGCPLFPATNVWHTDISHLPISPESANYIASIGLGGHLHPDFGAGLYDGETMGFSYTVVPGSQPAVPISFDDADESDPGPYPIPANAPVEGGAQSSGDRHVLVVDSGNCKLYEMYSSYPQKNGSWSAESGAVWDLNSNALRPADWTSADAAGLPILPGLISYDEVASGVINHALRFTVNRTQDAFLWPARHAASSNHSAALPPMGLRLRLKANVDISSFSRTNQIILTALKRYGMFVADNGSSWYLSGTSDDRWNNDDLHALSAIPGSDFEAVDESMLEMNASSGQAASSLLTSPASSPTTPPTQPALAIVTGSPSAATANTSPRQSTANNPPATDDGLRGNTFLLVILAVVFSGIVATATRLLTPFFLKKKRKNESTD